MSYGVYRRRLHAPERRLLAPARRLPATGGSLTALRRGLSSVLTIALLTGAAVVAGAPSSPAAVRPLQDPTAADAASTPSDLAAQSAKLAELDAEVKSTAQGLDRTRLALRRASLAASIALEDYGTSQRRYEAAQISLNEQQTALQDLTTAVSEAQSQVGEWARQAYASGADFNADLGLMSLIGSDLGSDPMASAGILRSVGSHRQGVVEQVSAARQRQAQLTYQVDKLTDAARDAANQATTAKAAADASVREQTRALAAMEAHLNSSTSAAKAQRALVARTAATVRMLASRRSNQLTGAVGACQGGDVSVYPNGQIPLSALCQLASSPSHYLRADAAFAFDRLAQEFTLRFGTPPCVTDSYRTLSSQVSLFATKPGLAAKPGTSNHGWGTAVDLCGGIQNFDTVQFNWMTYHAPLYGWYHPAWAQQGGSRPEPWHWEFGG